MYRFGSGTVSGLLPRILCWTRSGSREWRDRWLWACRGLGLQYTEVCREGERTDKHGHIVAWTTVYDVCGTPAALAELTLPGKYPVVERWEYFVKYEGPRPTDTGGIPVGQGTGSGPPKRPNFLPPGMTWQEMERIKNRPLPNA